ncbi:hypothetical protein SIID45300_01934 [Candidatus Magnetaquicoccaceae bacterium FCR-1]|uniref:Uncharacterized protein n=1 Tax=Candidatus Magnetaquiglobus chichijimensis TaxID=3141448 RepID=A0ABQ0C9N6_9PROT
MAFFLPEAHDGIDWRQGFEFLDKELSRITRDLEPPIDGCRPPGGELRGVMTPKAR